MADIAVQVIKETPWQGGAEQYSNVYTFNVDAFSGGIESDEIVIDILLAIERSVCTSVVRFVEARSYSIGGSAAGNVMRAVRDFPAGTTGQAVLGDARLYRECVILTEFDLPRSLILRRRRIGRKWMHTGEFPSMGVTTVTNLVAAGVETLPSAWAAAYNATYGQRLVSGNAGGQMAYPEGWQFGSGGDPFTTPRVSPFIEHRQFHR